MDDSWGKRHSLQPILRPTEYRCYIKEVILYGQRVRKSHRGKGFLRPPGNSPSQWHLTRNFLLCSALTIHDSASKVKSDFPYFSIFFLCF